MSFGNIIEHTKLTVGDPDTSSFFMIQKLALLIQNTREKWNLSDVSIHENVKDVIDREKDK